ncbi:hypothetical protein L1987_60800 [Smallanthus sonchifolius]|uniref:Uncharacterized protein n=1 Tax=Smallanthus sonchifolius TaxID=185202 RepID=A0ACB9D9W8_9ASTR|nr:hypothetical protein L1987_60800 [Smallanthus sonchifolius]
MMIPNEFQHKRTRRNRSAIFSWFFTFGGKFYETYHITDGRAKNQDLIRRIGSRRFRERYNRSNSSPYPRPQGNDDAKKKNIPLFSQFFSPIFLKVFIRQRGNVRNQEKSRHLPFPTHFKKHPAVPSWPVYAISAAAKRLGTKSLLKIILQRVQITEEKINMEILSLKELHSSRS